MSLRYEQQLHWHRKRIEDLEKTISMGSKSAYKRIEELEAELAKANKKASQRGARMQIMREWMELYRCDADYLTIWDRLIGERPEAKDWFDEDGVPR